MIEYNSNLNKMIKTRETTQTAVAEKVGMTTTIMSYIMAGRWNLTDDEKKLFAKALKCKVGDIF